MEKVAHFSKVSFEEFKQAFRHEDEARAREIYDSIKVPARATKGSAGYDFFSPYYVKLWPGESVKIPTGIRVQIDDGWSLNIFPRSSLGFKYRVQLDNTVGIIDQDYYYSDNEGHIFVKITNDSLNDDAVEINAGDKFVQGIFMSYGITYEDDATGVRNGGMGSTGA